MCWVHLSRVKATAGDMGEFATTCLLSPSICPLTSGHQRVLQSSEGIFILFGKWPLRRNLGMEHHCCLHPLVPCFCSAVSLPSLERVTSQLVLGKSPNFPGPCFIHLQTEIIKPTSFRLCVCVYRGRERERSQIRTVAGLWLEELMLPEITRNNQGQDGGGVPRAGNCVVL